MFVYYLYLHSKPTIMKKLFFICFLLICGNLFAQSKNNWHNINSKNMLPIDDSKIDSAIRSNKSRIEFIQSKLIIEKFNKKKSSTVNSDDKSIYWYIIDVNTNKIIDTIAIININNLRKIN